VAKPSRLAEPTWSASWLRSRPCQTTLPQSPEALWFIARAGFREAALRFGRQKDILLSSEQDLQALAERLGVRFAK